MNFFRIFSCALVRPNFRPGYSPLKIADKPPEWRPIRASETATSETTKKFETQTSVGSYR